MKTVETTEYKLEKNNGSYRFRFKLKNPQLQRFFDLEQKEIEYFNGWQNKGMLEYVESKIENIKHQIGFESITVIDNELIVKFQNLTNSFVENICDAIRDFYEQREMHVTRMFGSYILLMKENGILKAKKATEIPIKYCPLMVKLLNEVGGDNANSLLQTLKTENIELQKKNMCNLINDVVISGGYFDTNRPLNSCEANVLFGASETMSSALESGIIDCAVIVSNNLGTIITTNSSNTQGAVKRMTGLFFSSPSKKLVQTAINSKIIPVFPYTANIDQLEGVKQAIKLGYKKIAVSVASHDNFLHKSIKLLENDQIKIYKFGLCSTGIKSETAQIMKNYADVVWSCASKYVKEYIQPNSIAQVGIKIPVHIMTNRGFEIITNHLKHIDSTFAVDQNIKNPIFFNSNGKIQTISKDNLKKCTDCPHPCI